MSWYNPGTWFQESTGTNTSQLSEIDNQFVAAAMREGVDPAEFALALEDRGWNRLNLGNDGEIPWVTRRSNIIKARLYWLMDPLATAAVRTWTNYTMGSGMTIKAKDSKVQKLIDDFLSNPKNRTMTSAEGQRKHNRRLLVDGEMFFAFFDTAEDGIQMRKVDCTEVKQLVTDPQDVEVVWAYRREQRLQDGSFKVLYYRSWAYPNQDLSTAWAQDEAQQWVQGLVTAEEGVLVYHLAFDAIHQRGNSLFTSTITWQTALRQFMEDRISITKGLAKYIQKLTFKGGKNQAGKIAAAFQNLQRPGSAIGSVPVMPAAPIGIPGQPVRDTAKTFLQNDQVDLDNMPRLTGASDAKGDHKLLRLQLVAGWGLTEPYLGDAESGNLATATAMELPMLKQFESHQQLWGDAWVDICSIIANFDNPVPVEVDVDFPPIVTKDVGAVITAITNAVAEFPELKQPEILKLTLTALGLNNVDEIMKRVLITAKENEQQALNVAKGMAPDGSAIQQQQPTPVVLPAKPARQATIAGGQKVTLQQAAEAYAWMLHEENEELKEAVSDKGLVEEVSA